MAACVLASLGWAVFRWRRLDIEAVRLGTKGELHARLAGAEFVECRLLPGARVHPALIVMPLLCGGRRATVVIAPDSAAPDDRRRLRIWLNWLAGRQDAGASVDL